MKVTRQSPTTFLVEGASLRCNRPGCNYTFDLRRSKLKRHPGDVCPRCKAGRLETREHLVDLVPYESNGACGCETFQMRYEPELRRMSKLERVSCRMRCVHIHLAREHALDEVIALHAKLHEGK